MTAQWPDRSRQVTAGSRQVTAGSRQVTPGHARSRQVTPGHGWVTTGHGWVTPGHGRSRVEAVWRAVTGHGGNAVLGGDGCRWSCGVGADSDGDGDGGDPGGSSPLPLRGHYHLQLGRQQTVEH